VDGVLFCHASPRRDDELLTRLSQPQRWQQALAGTTAALVVAGHTHQQDDRVVSGVRFVNAGWPDERSVNAALIDPLEPIVITRIFEELAGDS
jgi:predicted phosphodiesterase